MIEGLDKETLKRLYITEQRTIREIAKLFGLKKRAGKGQ
jgi:hypothetical protein